MKELSIEEKAKAYDEAIERAKVFKEHLLEIDEKDYADEMDYVFPALKETEDERIRKTLVAVVNLYYGEGKDEEKTACLAWLEKQGEQKYIPKYKIGDYVKNTNYKGEPIYEIVYMDKECYICEYRGKERMGDKAVMHFSFDNPYLRLVQKPAEWSEEDEEMIDSIIGNIQYLYSLGSCDNATVEMKVNWLKSLRPQNTWKPSEKQMEALHKSLCHVGNSTAIQISKLISDLKKL